jgi:hypothetical protein
VKRRIHPLPHRGPDPNGLNFGYETLGDTSGVTCTGVPAP